MFVFRVNRTCGESAIDSLADGFARVGVVSYENWDLFSMNEDLRLGIESLCRFRVLMNVL